MDPKRAFFLIGAYCVTVGKLGKGNFKIDGNGAL